MYGNKVIGINRGIFDMHGKVRNVTFDFLSTSVAAGVSQIVLERAVDW
jgi:hypothetical protein